MSDHDPLCPNQTHPFPDTCEGCLLIKRTAARETAEWTAVLDDVVSIAQTAITDRDALTYVTATLKRERDAAIGELADIANRTYGAEGIHQRNYVAERDLQRARDEIERLQTQLLGWACQRCGQKPIWAECGNARCNVKVHPYCACDRDDEVDGHWCEDGCPSKVLADLRAKVEALTPAVALTPGFAYAQALRDVLALIEEVDHG